MALIESLTDCVHWKGYLFIPMFPQEPSIATLEKDTLKSVTVYLAKTIESMCTDPDSLNYSDNDNFRYCLELCMYTIGTLA